MKIYRYFSLTIALLMAFTSCSSEEPTFPPEPIPDIVEEPYKDYPIYQRHKDSMLKILAIGNSFTTNAGTYLPWFINRLNGDSICMAKLTRSGCSLSMHWSSHLGNTPDYDFYYSDNGKWEEETDVKTIDEALDIFDWDIIVIQQQSGTSGVYATYQPALDYLVELFGDTNPAAKLAWHYTWPYKEGTTHGDFLRYDSDPEKMYNAILEAGDIASENFDIKIPAATLIWDMRQQYPEVEDQFSTDGYHISSNLALYALSTLWYECLMAPQMSTSALDQKEYPSSITAEDFAKAQEIIRSLVKAKAEVQAPFHEISEPPLYK